MGYTARFVSLERSPDDFSGTLNRQISKSKNYYICPNEEIEPKPKFILCFFLEELLNIIFLVICLTKSNNGDSMELIKNSLQKAIVFVVSFLIFASIAQSKTKVTWGMWGSPSEIKTHQRVADAFMASHPNIEIVIWGQPWGDYFTKLQTLWAAGDKEGIPDVLFLSPVVTYAGQGVLEPLDDYISASNYDTSDYWPSLLQFGTLKGTIYGLPRDIGLEVLYYNKDIFDEAGVDYPTNFWTWDDLKSASSKLSKITSSGRVQRYALAMEQGKYQLFIGQNRGGILDDMINPTRCTLTEPESVEAVKFFAELMNEKFAMRPSALSQAGGDAGVFQSGQAAMIIQNASRISAFNAAKMNYDVAAVPIPADGQRAGSAGGAAWTMSKYSDDKDAAWIFLSWLQSTEGGQAIYTASGEILPALRSTAVSDSFLGINAPPANRAAFIIEGNNTKIGRSGYFPNWGPLNGKVLAPNLDRIWSGTEQVEQVLQQTCGEVNEFLQSNGLGF